MKILSLFDGMSCGRIALERAGIKVDKYYASEIKPYAIECTQANYPDTIQLGDVRNIKAEDLPQIDFLIGGSPCQDFSQANKERKGLQGIKSGLFFEYIRLLYELKPKYFLLENVKMSKDQQHIITNILKDIYPDTVVYNINSKLVSAQLRNRFYWTNIQGIEQPKDKQIKLQDILENGYTDRIKSRAILESESRPLVSKDKMWHRYYNTGFTTIVYENNIEDKTNIRYFTQTELERLQTVPEGYTKMLNRNKAACLLGDGWTVDVIAHIFSYLKKDELS